MCGYALIAVMTLHLSVLLVLRWIVSGHVPLSNGFETMQFMAWSVLILTLLMPVLHSPLLSLHVMVIMFSYALFAMIMLIGIQGLVCQHRGDIVRSESLAALAHFLLYPAVFLLAAGIFIGGGLGQCLMGTLLELGSEGGMGSCHHAYLHGAFPFFIHQVFPQYEVLPVLLYCGVSQCPDYLFRCEFSPRRNAQLRITGARALTRTILAGTRTFFWGSLGTSLSRLFLSARRFPGCSTCKSILLRRVSGSLCCCLPAGLL